MYIAVCAFDKTINVFDFFSGDLLVRLAGHSELITGLKFTPDGRSLISFGGKIRKSSLNQVPVQIILTV
jgi:WD40 repeat protein